MENLSRGLLFWLTNEKSACLTCKEPRKGVAKDYEWLKKENFILSPPYPFDQTFGRCGAVDCYNHHIPKFKAAAIMCS